MTQQGKVALITGANKGIGLETARQLGQLGITVLVGARDLAKGQKAADQLRSEGIDARSIQLDVVNQSHIAAAVTGIESDFGKLDILVNNAGVMVEDGFGPNDATTVTIDQLRQTFDTNVFAVVALTQALLPLLRKSPAGRIVNVSSILGSNTLHATPGSRIYEGKGAFAYDASKAALNSFTIHLAHALQGTDIKVNSAHPGWVKTDMGGSGAMMELVDGAKTEVDLATLPDDGPTGAYVHLGKTIPW